MTFRTVPFIDIKQNWIKQNEIHEKSDQKNDIQKMTFKNDIRKNDIQLCFQTSHFKLDLSKPIHFNTLSWIDLHFTY